MASSLDAARPSSQRSPYPWGLAVLAFLATATAYFLLPRLVPDELAGEMAALLLGLINGIAVGVALRVDRRLLPAFALGAGVGVLAWLLQVDGLEVFVIGVSVAIGAEVWLFAHFLRRTGAALLRDPSDLLRFAVVVLAITTPIGVAVSALGLVDHLPFDDFLHATRSWIIDDLFGLLVIAPAIITFGRAALPSIRLLPEYGLAIGYTALSTWYVFFVVTPGSQGLLGWPYLVVLGSIWVAVRMGLRPVAPIVAVQFWVITIATVSGRGAMSGAAPDALDRVLVAEMFGIVMALVIFALALLRDGQEQALRRTQEASLLLREVVDGSGSLIFAKSYEGEDADAGRYVLVNRQWEVETGTTTDATLEHSDRDLWPAEVADAFIRVDHDVLSQGVPLEVNESNLDASGHRRQYLSSKFPLRHPNGMIWGVGGIATDITEVLESRAREERQAELLHAVFELSPTPAVRLTMREGEGVRVRAANASMCALLGAPEGHYDACDLLDHVHPEDTAVALDVLTYAADNEVPGAPATRQRELRMLSEDGRTVWALMSAAAVRGVGDDLELVAQFEDVTARRAAELALTEQAMRDAVTGLPNRRALRERLESALLRLRRHPGWVTVLFCDLDHFKDVNDSLGHHVGDRLLVEVADRLRGALRPEDTIARLGGDEFVALGEGIADPNDAVLMAMRLQDRLSAPWVFAEQVFRPAMSIGIAMTNTPDMSVDELLRRADLAMYRAKEAGRNRVELYDRSVDDRVQQAVTIQHELRRAIDTGGLELHYQPIVRLSDGVITGMEGLVRLRDQSGRLLPPGDFVPQAEATGLVIPMGAWVVQQALHDLALLHRDNHDVAMSINVSPTQLREDGFADFLLEQIAFAGVRPSCLAIEVTETALIHDPVRSARELSVLSEAGVRIALDDFGTGYSSLTWLTQFPVNIVKIDKSFTDELGLDERKTAIVHAVISVSHELGFTVVAEGIETQEQADRLTALGCDRGQGYLYGKPTPIEESPWT